MTRSAADRRIPCARLGIAAASLAVAAAAGAQAPSRWTVTDSAGACGVLTTMNRQPLPSLGFGLSAERRDSFTMLIKGNMNYDGTPPRTADIRFGGERIAARNVGITLLEQPNIYGITVTFDATHLRHFAEQPQFAVYLDNELFANYALAERGEMVVSLVRCMRRLPAGPIAR